MSGELQRHDPTGSEVATRPDFHAPTEIDQWVLVVRDVARLAAQIADTPFVPDSYRGNPAAVTAAILTGREMGLGPLTSLQHIHIVKGKPGKSAEIMRGMVLAAGHHLRDVEVNDTRVILEGRRSNEEVWTRVTFTADQARRAKIDLGGYPEDKLYARATTRLCRRKFADVVGGIALTVEELEDGDYPDTTSAPQTGPPGPATPEATPPAKRTARRRTGPKKAAPAEEPPRPSTASENARGDAEETPPDPPATPPPLPGDDEDETDEDDDAETVSRTQLDKLHAQLGDLQVTDRADKLTTVSILVRRKLGSSSEMTKNEASQAIDILAHVLDSEDPARTLEAVLAELDA
ncbi:hypothetical protein [Amycolatopsis sp. lyj-84]|uniref:hypothetical protein n=1 Tax=Amycolatopsis sp. lyj-84 TaxID=2789284 RepID=UPI00397A9C34